MQRKIEVTLLVSLAVLTAAGLIALVMRGKERARLGGGPVPPQPLP